VTWQSVAGRTYRVQKSDDLRTWSDVASIIATEAASTYTTNTAGTRRAYRVVTP
jgi:hypothetical protein